MGNKQNEINFEVIYKGHQNCLKAYSVNMPNMTQNTEHKRSMQDTHRALVRPCTEVVLISFVELFPFVKFCSLRTILQQRSIKFFLESRL